MHSDLVAGTLNNQLAGLMKILYLSDNALACILWILPLGF